MNVVALPVLFRHPVLLTASEIELEGGST